MENVTTPGQVVFLGVLFLVFCILAWWWLRSGVPRDTTADDTSAGELVSRGWEALLHWRPSHMSSSNIADPVRTPNEPVRTGGSTGADDAARARLHQVAPESEPQNAPSHELVSLHMSRETEIAWLAVQRNDDGTYRHSANKIAALMGGTESIVKAQIAAIRAKKEVEAKPSGMRLDRPPQGWPS